jgi:hypothetical protein
MSPHPHRHLTSRERRKFNTCKYMSRKWVKNHEWVTKSGNRLHFTTANLREASASLRREVGGWSMDMFERLAQASSNQHQLDYHRFDTHAKRQLLANSSIRVIRSKLVELTRLEYKRHVRCSKANHRMVLSPEDLFGSSFFKHSLVNVDEVT